MPASLNVRISSTSHLTTQDSTRLPFNSETQLISPESPEQNEETVIFGKSLKNIEQQAIPFLGEFKDPVRSDSDARNSVVVTKDDDTSSDLVQEVVNKKYNSKPIGLKTNQKKGQCKNDNDSKQPTKTQGNVFQRYQPSKSIKETFDQCEESYDSPSPPHSDYTSSQLLHHSKSNKIHSKDKEMDRIYSSKHEMKWTFIETKGNAVEAPTSLFYHNNSIVYRTDSHGSQIGHEILTSHDYGGNILTISCHHQLEPFVRRKLDAFRDKENELFTKIEKTHSFFTDNSKFIFEIYLKDIYYYDMIKKALAQFDLTSNCSGIMSECAVWNCDVKFLSKNVKVINVTTSLAKVYSVEKGIQTILLKEIICIYQILYYHFKDTSNSRFFML